MAQPVPVVDASTFAEAAQDAEQGVAIYGEVGELAAFIRSLEIEFTEAEVIAACYRYVALCGLLKKDDLASWTKRLKGGLVLADKAVIRAAARAPLFEAGNLMATQFDPATFVPVVLQEAQAAGRA